MAEEFTVKSATLVHMDATTNQTAAYNALVKKSDAVLSCAAITYVNGETIYCYKPLPLDVASHAFILKEATRDAIATDAVVKGTPVKCETSFRFTLKKGAVKPDESESALVKKHCDAMMKEALEEARKLFRMNAEDTKLI